MISLEDWLEDRESAVPEHWGTRQFYREALDLGVVDPKIIARALATVDAAHALSKSLGIDFDSAVYAINTGVVMYTLPLEDWMTLRWRFYLYTHTHLFALRWSMRALWKRLKAAARGYWKQLWRR